MMFSPPRGPSGESRELARTGDTMSIPNRQISRRQFVRSMGAAMTAPTIVSASALGNSERPVPSERITVGCIGVGKMANDYLLPSIRGCADVQAGAVCDVDTNRRLH